MRASFSFMWAFLPFKKYIIFLEVMLSVSVRHFRGQRGSSESLKSQASHSDLMLATILLT